MAKAKNAPEEVKAPTESNETSQATVVDNGSSAATLSEPAAPNNSDAVEAPPAVNENSASSLACSDDRDEATASEDAQKSHAPILNEGRITRK